MQDSTDILYCMNPAITNYGVQRNSVIKNYL